jgi:Mn-containing catalase
MPTAGGAAKGRKPAAKHANTAKAGKGNPAPLSDPDVSSFFPYHFSGSAQTALPYDGFGNPWNGSYVTSTGNLKMDLLHNFFLECGARAGKARVYEMTDDPTARAMIGYLLVRGGVHIVAYAKALEKLTGADVGRLLPIPSVSNKRFPEAAKLEAEGLHTIMWCWSQSDLYEQIGQIWTGPHPEDGEELEVRMDMPPGFKTLDSKTLFPAIAAFNKRHQTLSAELFDGTQPTADHFMRVAQESFGTEVYSVLGKYVLEKKAGPGVIATILDVSPMDARAYLEALAI